MINRGACKIAEKFALFVSANRLLEEIKFLSLSLPAPETSYYTLVPKTSHTASSLPPRVPHVAAILLRTHAMRSDLCYFRFCVASPDLPSRSLSNVASTCFDAD